MIIAGGALNTQPLSVSVANVGGVMGNGTSVTCTITAVAEITGGFPPYTYSWTDNNANVFVQASTSATTRLQSTGTNQENNGSLILIVGQANGVLTTVSASFNYVHGTP